MTKKSDNEDLLSSIHEIFEEKVPFNQVIGLQIVEMDIENPKAVIRFEMREELIGNYHHGILHGGVTAAVIDVTGGLTAFLGAHQKNVEDTLDKKLARFGRLGTIDMRIDYLRPGLGRWFVATGHILRTGKKVAVTRVELHNDKGRLIAVGTAAYTVS